MGKQANRVNEVVFVKDLSPHALPNTAERRCPTRQEFCAQRGSPDYELLKAAITGIDVAGGKHAILLVDHSPYVGGKMMARRRLQQECTANGVPIFTLALAADQVGSQYVTARLATSLASEWAGGTLAVPDDEKSDDTPPPPSTECGGFDPWLQNVGSKAGCHPMGWVVALSCFFGGL